MPQTLQNKAVTPINSDGYNLVADLASMGNSLTVPIRVSSLSERNALSLVAGLQVVRLDLPGCPVQTYDGFQWYGQSSTNISAVTLNGLYQARASGYANPGVYVNPAGRVCLVGAATNIGTVTWNATTVYSLGSVPSQFAPASTVDVPFMFRIQPTPYPSYMTITTAGAITFALSTTLSGIGAGLATLSLEGSSWALP